MTLDKRHMAVALTMLAGSVVYNVSVFSKPTAASAAGPAVAAAPSLASGGAVAAHPELSMPAAAVADAPDVVLTRPPVWPRDPFARREAEPPAIVDPIAPAEAPEPDVVVNSVLYSSTRKLAMVNGRTMRIGDRIGSSAIVDILPDAIVVESANGGVRTIARRSARGSSRR
jgi:hypothetical protein